MKIYKKIKKPFRWFITEPRYKGIGLISVIIAIIVGLASIYRFCVPTRPELSIVDLSAKILENAMTEAENNKNTNETNKFLEFKLANIGEGTACIKEIRFEILDFRKDIPYGFPLRPKLPTIINNYKIVISPDIKQYIIVGDGKYHFPSGDEEKFVIGIESTTQGYYTIRIFVDWYNQKKSKIINHLSSNIHEVFLGGIKFPDKNSLPRSRYKDLEKKLSLTKKTFEAAFFSKHYPHEMNYVLKFLPKDVEVRILVPLSFYYKYYKQRKQEIMLSNRANVKIKPFIPFENIQYEFMLIDDKKLVIKFGEDKGKKYKDEDVVKIYSDIFNSVWEQTLTSYFNLSKDNLIKELGNGNVFIRRFALNRLTDFGDQDVIDAVLLCLTDPIFDIRAEAALFLSGKQEIKAVGHFISMLETEHYFIIGLGGLSFYDYQISGVATIPILKWIEKKDKREENAKENLSSKYDFLPLMDVWNLWDICDERVLPLLQSITSNSNEDLRTEALEAIEKIKNNMEKIRKNKNKIYKHKDVFRDYYFREKQINKVKKDFAKGLDYFKEKNYSKAETFFIRSISLDYRFSETHEMIGDFYREWSAYESNKGNLNSAIEKCKLSVKNNSRKYGAYVHWGDILSWLGRIGESIDKFKIAISIDPDDPYAYFKLGIILFTQAKYEESIKQFKKVTEVDGKYEVFAYLLWGGALQELNRLEESAKIYEIASKKYSNISSLEVPKELKKAIELNPKILDMLQTYKGN